ncbi:MAG: putative amidoligase enzyme [Roseibaca calidilacus]|uniref:Amidoligase enzyme n=1 Tax=Roseibaca calidilacus TaxID=1666912 RepID=A0A0P7WYH2_9RHOB|nr:amidoligase family protein [Roseibaca calidilacus]KPP92664.1 MAG: putative amidoligase enzyme [Roseibaca calidilacus]CUX80263.1 Putative amidoligase enzyme [Roseibaca calidilacus]
MTDTLHRALPRDRFLPLPDHAGPSRDRRTGVEVEFAGLTPEQAAQIVQAEWGGTITREGPRDLLVADGRFGPVKVELDITLKTRWIEDLAVEILGDLVPVEIVTAPMAQRDLPQVAALLTTLARAGAKGSGAHVGYGFGVHLNTERPDDPATIAIVRAFALLEDWLRQSDPLDPARRVLPFVDPWPRALVDALAGADDWSLADLGRVYAKHAPSRGYGLDLLPLLQDAVPDTLANVPADQLKGGRPTFHYRLPETRLDEVDWSLAYEWNRWWVVEQVAKDSGFIHSLANIRQQRGLWPTGEAAEIAAKLWQSAIIDRIGG